MKFGMVVHLGLLSGSTLKFLIFELSKMAVATILKITKIAISQQQFNQSSQNLVRWCKMGLLTATAITKFEFSKSKMVDGRRFENRKWVWSTIGLSGSSLIYSAKNLHNRSINYDEIWHDDASWPLFTGRSLKFRIFENQHGGSCHPEKHKIRKSQQRFDQSSWHLAWWCKIGLLTVPAAKRFQFLKILYGRQQQCWNLKNCFKIELHDETLLTFGNKTANINI